MSRPVPKLHIEPWSPRDADYKRAARNDGARQKKCVLAGTYPFSGQPMLAQMRLTAAVELAGARGSFGRIGAQSADLAQIAVTALTRNQEAGARLLGTRNLD